MHTIRSLRYVILAFPFLLSVGCGGYSPEAHRVDAGQARTLLENVLASWREGETPESWKLKSPAVVIQDFDWQSGAKLNSFEIVDQGEPVDANLHCRVKLNFTDSRKKDIERTVTYLIGTSPALTVFREPGP
jgi:hypothetical protein